MFNGGRVCKEKKVTAEIVSGQQISLQQMAEYYQLNMQEHLQRQIRLTNNSGCGRKTPEMNG